MLNGHNEANSLSFYPVKPYKQNALFTGGAHTALNACVGRNGGPYGLTDYASGYMKGGRRIANSLMENSISQDTVVYPLVFVYRHAIELYLKQLTECLLRIAGLVGKPCQTHNLADNWSLIKPLIVAHATSFDPDAILIPLVDAVISDLIEIDPDGQAFRYPHARTGSRFLQETSLINIKVFADAIDMIAEVMDSWIYTASTLLEV